MVVKTNGIQPGAPANEDAFILHICRNITLHNGLLRNVEQRDWPHKLMGVDDGEANELALEPSRTMEESILQ